MNLVAKGGSAASRRRRETGNWGMAARAGPTAVHTLRYPVDVRVALGCVDCAFPADSQVRLTFLSPTSARQDRRRDAPVPGGSPGGQCPTGPSDPAATPARCRPPGGAPTPATSPVAPAGKHPNRFPSLVKRSSNPAGGVLLHSASLRRDGLLVVGGDAGV
jgi:hypothetical protein